MSNLKVKLSQLTTKKVPALALVVCAMLGMVAGVLAANLAVSQTSTTGEIGTYHTSSGTFTVTDTGLFVVANGASTNATTAITIVGTGIALNNALTAGDWMDVVTFVMSTPSATGSPHTATLTFRQGTAGPKGTILGSAVTSGAWTTSTSSTGTVTFYVDLGTQSLTSPVTAYISIT
jgi:hypothetical protein